MLWRGLTAVFPYMKRYYKKDRETRACSDRKNVFELKVGKFTLGRQGSKEDIVNSETLQQVGQRSCGGPPYP